MKSLLIGTTCYGQHYYEMFVRWALPSLLSAGNLPALVKQRKILLRIHTDEETYKLMRLSLPLPSDIELRYILDVFPDGDRYCQLGRQQSDDLRAAKTLGADYHCLLPDFIYSENCLSAVLAKAAAGYKVISRLVYSTNMEAILPELEFWKHQGVVSISAINLATLALQYIHPGCRNWLSSTRVYPTTMFYPKTHVTGWEGEHSVTALSPHQSPLFIAHQAIGDIPEDIVGGIDEIMHRASTGDIYSPQVGDEMGVIEVTPRAGRRLDDDMVSLGEFILKVKNGTGGSLVLTKLFLQGTTDSILRAQLPAHKFMKYEEIAAARKVIEDALVVL